jgi:hypothetical protein
MVVTVACLLVGAAVACWRANSRLGRAEDLAQAQAALVGTGLQGQFDQAEAAVEMLWVLANQNAGIQNFQKSAGSVLALRPGVASLELQPGGITTDIYPRLGNERALGLNVLKDPARRGAAGLAMQKHTASVAGPVPLMGGEQAMVVLAPIYQRAAGGQETFWGFVSANLRLPEALGRAGFNELAAKGYNYALVIAGSPKKKATILAETGAVLPTRAILQPIRVRNVEFRLLLCPRRGWISFAELAIDVAGVILISGLLGAVTAGVNKHRRGQAELEQLQQGLSRERSAREDVETERQTWSAKAAGLEQELTASRGSLEQTQTQCRELREKLEAAMLSGKERSHAGQAAAQRAEERIADLERQLEERSSAAQQGSQALKAELERARQMQTRFEQLETNNREVEARLNAAMRSAREAEEMARQAAAKTTAKITDLEAQLLRAAAQADQTTTAATRNPQGKIAELEHQVQELSKTAQEASQALKAEREKRQHLEASNRDLEARLRTTRDEQRQAEEAARATAKEAETKMANLEAQSRATAPPPTQTACTRQASEAEASELKPRKLSLRSRAPKEQMDLWKPEPVVVSVPERKSEPVQATAAGPAPTTTTKAKERAGEPVEAAQSADMPASRPAAKIERTSEPREPKPAPVRAPVGPVHPDFRKTVHQILPLLVDQDPGAKDCLKDNRAVFRSGFAPEHYAEFEQMVKEGRFNDALESLKKAAKRSGMTV